MAILDDIVNDLKARIDKTCDDLKKEFARVRTGRANLAILDGIKVDYYGAPTPLNGVANLTVADPRMIIVKPWDKKMLQTIEKALREANIGINPMNDGDIIRLPVPQLTEERRKEIVKQCKTKGEDHKIAIRNERRDAKELIAASEKDGEISADDAKKALEKMQKETDEGVKKVDEIVAAKEKEVMQV